MQLSNDAATTPIRKSPFTGEERGQRNSGEAGTMPGSWCADVTAGSGGGLRMSTDAHTAQWYPIVAVAMPQLQIVLEPELGRSLRGSRPRTWTWISATW